MNATAPYSGLMYSTGWVFELTITVQLKKKTVNIYIYILNLNSVYWKNFCYILYHCGKFSVTLY